MAKRAFSVSEMLVQSRAEASRQAIGEKDLSGYNDRAKT
jgi:hypothetical protein